MKKMQQKFNQMKILASSNCTPATCDTMQVLHCEVDLSLICQLQSVLGSTAQLKGCGRSIKFEIVVKTRSCSHFVPEESHRQAGRGGKKK